MYPCVMKSPVRYSNSFSKMQTLACLGKNFPHFCGCSCMKVFSFSMSVRRTVRSSFRFFIFTVKPCCVLSCYFLLVSFLGFLFLKLLDPKDPSFRPGDLDLFFTSVSATTVSSMATVEMEVFSNAQLIVITMLMLIGGEVFMSMLDFQLMKVKCRMTGKREVKVESVGNELKLHSIGSPVDVAENVELGLVIVDESKSQNLHSLSTESQCLRYLSFVVLGYLLVIHLAGSLLVFLYVSLVRSARDVLMNKGIKRQIFAVFTTVSTFSNCGFIPTNENMMVFRKNSGLLLLLVPQVLMGNTLFPSCLRTVVWVLKKITKKVEFDHILKNPEEIRNDQLLQPLHCLLLVPTAIGFILVQLILFCSMEWHSEALSEMSSFQKIVGALFQSTNTRHAGESIVDISALAPAILVLFVVMMYLPPYTSFLPVLDSKSGGKVGWVNSLIFSQLSYLCVCVILICLTENSKMREDPINFSVINVVLEVTSAYGNVGYSTGYSCQRRLKQDGYCKDASYGFVGRWSDGGKLILIFVMFLGRLRKFNMNGGKPWKFHRSANTN